MFLCCADAGELPQLYPGDQEPENTIAATTAIAQAIQPPPAGYVNGAMNVSAPER